MELITNKDYLLPGRLKLIRLRISSRISCAQPRRKSNTELMPLMISIEEIWNMG